MSARGSRGRLLLVDDDRTMLDHMSSMVADAGYTAACATTWTDALRLFREDPPDLVLLDVMMPTIDGYKLAKMIKAESTSFVPIILLTALEDLESKRRGMAAGADDFLSKPVTALELQIRLSSMLRIKLLTDELQHANAKLAELAVTDPLTNLANRRSLYQHLDREFSRSRRYGHPLALMMIDIDHFKQVNDTYGHQTGDRVLRLVADVLRSNIRGCDVAGRFGGEEFMVLAPETGPDSIRPMCERIRSSVQVSSGTAAAGANGPEKSPPVTVSIGAATTVITPAETIDELIHLADDALYRAKREGRNRIVLAE